MCNNHSTQTDINQIKITSRHKDAMLCCLVNLDRLHASGTKRLNIQVTIVARRFASHGATGKISLLVFTAGQGSCRKVMFSVVSVSLSTGGVSMRPLPVMPLDSHRSQGIPQNVQTRRLGIPPSLVLAQPSTHIGSVSQDMFKLGHLGTPWTCSNFIQFVYVCQQAGGWHSTDAFLYSWMAARLQWSFSLTKQIFTK